MLNLTMTIDMFTFRLRNPAFSAHFVANAPMWLHAAGGSSDCAFGPLLFTR